MRTIICPVARRNSWLLVALSRDGTAAAYQQRRTGEIVVLTAPPP